MSMWLPASACPHPAASLFGEWDQPTQKLAVMCRSCGRAWTDANVPGDVIDRLEELLDAGGFKPIEPVKRQ
jgi:hypothetical protein